MTHNRAGWIGAVLAAGLLASCSSGSLTHVASSSDSSSDSSSGASSGISPGSTAPSEIGPSPRPGVAQPLRSDKARGAAGKAAVAGAALDSLGAKLLVQLPAGENALLSPYSIYDVLAMARAGAKGDTALQLDAVLGGDAVTQAGNVTAIDRAVASALAAGKPDPQMPDSRPEAVDVANSIWLSPALPVRPAYLDALATGFGVGVYDVDYQADPEAARRVINSWVDQHTGKLIPELIGKEVITESTVLTLVNALHLSAPWAKPFTKQDSPILFTTSAGSKTAAPAMSLAGAYVSSSGRGWTSVTIPYRGGGLAMTVVLPDQGSFAAVRAELPTVLRAATASRAALPMSLAMPTFGSQTHLSLKAAMRSLGVTDIFNAGAADLSGIAGSPGDLFATELIHQSVIKVDENETEAAAATAMTMAPSSGLVQMGAIKTITVDRPFFYSVHDTATGAPLFLGQVTDPIS